MAKASLFARLTPARSFWSFSRQEKLVRCFSLAASRLENIIYSDHPSCELPRVSLPQYLFDRFDRFSNHFAVECGITRKKYTYDEIRRLSERFGAGLIRLGLRKGDILGVVLPNCPEWAFMFLGAACAGVTVTPINPVYSTDEIIRQFNSCSVKAVLCHHMIGTLLQPKMHQIPTAKKYISAFGHLDGWIEMENVLTDDGLYFRHADVDLDNDPIILPYSSGTTGLPKGVVLSHSNFVHNLCQFQTPGTLLIQEATSDFQEKYISVLPYFHIYGLVVTLFSGLWHGAHITVLPKFEPELFLKTAASVKPTVLQLVPPLISFLANTPNLDRRSFENLHTVMSGAAPLGRAIGHKFLERINNPFLFLQEVYGLTETSPLTHVAPLRGYKIGSCGKLVSRTEAKIVDTQTGESLPAEAEGELYIRGPQVMRGYYNNPEATASTIDSAGWLHTGDIAKYDSEQRFYVVDRLKELIKVKGLQVAPSELEDLLRKHPSVLDVAVIGIPDDRSGEVPRAYIVIKNGSDLTEKQIADFVAEQVAPYKHLHGGVLFVDAIPKSNTGKILRRELKKAALSS